ncbi:hypothetical protein Ahy_A01g004902 isoform B [Arachis hypogaea]|uniref:DUF8204 domain-containing protein n=1 Tax=Arachis hypogaea TaxID=3818 RepID=A0A445EXH0_ARAHY|nr:hypothetical protein Ahy_A01g004902 isoform B [Arachis hypogaea]
MLITSSSISFSALSVPLGQRGITGEPSRKEPQLFCTATLSYIHIFIIMRGGEGEGQARIPAPNDKANPNPNPNTNPNSPNNTTRGSKARSCKGCAYYSSVHKSKSKNPTCVGFSSTLQQVPPYDVGETELEASKEGRSVANFKYACLGYSFYLDNKDSSADSQDKTAKLPFCTGLEIKPRIWLVETEIAAVVVAVAEAERGDLGRKLPPILQRPEQPQSSQREDDSDDFDDSNDYLDEYE